MSPRPLVPVMLMLSACAVGPNYRRPALDVPAGYRGEIAPDSISAPTASLGDEQWWDLFQDPVLQQLIRTALKDNFDIRIAAARVQQVQAQLSITRAAEFPAVNAGAGYFTQRNAKIAPIFPAYQARAAQVDLSVIWNLDFWGKYRRETEAARANLLASEWGRRAVMTSLVSGVAAAYFELRELDLALQIARDTLSSRENSLRLTKLLVANGSASQLDLRQTEELVFTAAENVPDLERQIAQQENALSVLIGGNPGDVPRGRALTDLAVPAVVPAGLPSELLERRPDIVEAEQNLIAANADVGVAKAAYFPSISLTATGGFESYQFSNLFTPASHIWDLSGSLMQPVFEAGSLRAGTHLAEAQEQQLLLTYEQTVKTAFQQVSDALIAYRKNREFREQQQKLAAAAQDADRLSNVLYRQGGASYLQVLTSETNYFAAQLNLAQSELSERLAVIQLYSALGGGWRQEP